MSRDKSRHEITVKLLEIYHARKSAQSFETVARELKEAIGATTDVAKVAAMGSSIDPQNPLYSGSARLMKPRCVCSRWRIRDGRRCGIR